MLKFISVNFEFIGGIFVAILDIKKAGDLVLKQQAQPIERMIWQKLCIKLMV